MKFPKVSVLLPVYNRQDYISDAIESVVKQDYPNIELIIVDNCSTDSTWDIVCQWKNNYPDIIRIYQNNSNVGPVNNWKRCLEKSTGDYIKFLFSDDMIFTDCISSLLNSMSSDSAFVISPVLIGESTNKCKVYYQLSKNSQYITMHEYLKMLLVFSSASYSPGNSLFRKIDVEKCVITDVSYPRVHSFLSHGAGTDLLMHLLISSNEKYKNISYVSKPLCFFRRHEGSFTIGERAKEVQFSYTISKLFFVNKYSCSKCFISEKFIIHVDWLKYIIRFKTLISFKEYANLLSNKIIAFSLKLFIRSTVVVLSIVLKKIIARGLR
jgi:glycosyltransferase involved in cell wall biosynthesis